MRIREAGADRKNMIAELAGCNIYDFMSICKTNQQPVIDMTRDELLEELNGFSQL